MHLRHIDPHTTDWMDAMLEEGKGKGKGEAEAELEASKEDQATSAAPMMAAPLAKGPPVHDGPPR
jgi:hypothetical protein